MDKSPHKPKKKAIELPEFGAKIRLPHFAFNEMRGLCNLPIVETEAMVIRALPMLTLVYIGEQYGFRWRTVSGLWFISSEWWGGKQGDATRLNTYVVTGVSDKLAEAQLKKFFFKVKALAIYALLDDDVQMEDWLYAAQEESDYHNRADWRRRNWQWLARHAPNWQQRIIQSQEN